MNLSKLLLQTSALITFAPLVHAQVTLAVAAGGTQLDLLGRAVDVGPDVDGDGVKDLLVGCKNVQSGYGAVQIRSGKTLAVLSTTSSPADDLNQPDDQYGAALAVLGDIDSDGRIEYVVGAPFADTDTGMTIISDAGAIFIRDIGSSDIFAIRGNKMNSRFGATVVKVGDLNADGVADLAVGAPLDDKNTAPGNPYADAGTNEGRVTVYSGKTLNVLHTFWGLSNSEYGAAICALGDVDQDGYADFGIGSPGDDTSGFNAGFFVAKSGKTGASMWMQLGFVTNGRLGASVAGPGDVNGDGKRDYAYGAPGESNGGAVRVHPGPWGGAAIWSQSAGVPGLLFGTAMAAAGDLNHDGRGDLVIGAPSSSPTGTGLVRLHSGLDGSSMLSADAGSADFGSVVAGLGDLDNDGWNEYAAAGPKTTGTAGDADDGFVRLMGAWVDQLNLGNGGPGTSFLRMRGFPLATGGKADLTLTGAPASTSAYLLLSATLLNLPAAGGIVVPNITQGIILPFGTDAAGKFSILNVPGGYANLKVYAQTVAVDPLLPKGYAFSNGLEIQLLP